MTGPRTVRSSIFHLSEAHDVSMQHGRAEGLPCRVGATSALNPGASRTEGILAPARAARLRMERCSPEVLGPELELFSLEILSGLPSDLQSDVACGRERSLWW